MRKSFINRLKNEPIIYTKKYRYVADQNNDILDIYRMENKLNDTLFYHNILYYEHIIIKL